MRLSSREQARIMDQNSLLSGGLAPIELMETAGRLSADFIFRQGSKRKIRSYVILVGPGNNGADGMVVARYLAPLLPSQVCVVLCTSAVPAPAELWTVQRKSLESLPLRVVTVEQLPELDENIMVIDALFGTGLNRALEEPLQLLVKKINASSAPVISLDGPSGLDSDTGNILGASVKAEWTLAFNLAKPGFYLNHGPSCCGRIRVLDIGIPAILKKETRLFLVNRQSAQKLLPSINPLSNKSSRGRSLIFAGSSEYPGAAVLCCRAALRSGTGYVVLAQKKPPFMALQNPDFLVIDWSKQDWKKQKISSAAIGPGFGVNKDTLQLLRELKKEKVAHVVVDADALSVCAREEFFSLPATWVATPHAGELSRILNVASDKIEADRVHYAQEAHKKMGCVVVLKGYHTVVASSVGNFIINSGNSALAKSGTGDVLAGMITAFLAQGLSSLRAALLACYVHGLVADLWISRGKDSLSLMASDVIEELPSTLALLRSP